MLSSGAKELQLGETEVSDVGGDGGNGYRHLDKARRDARQQGGVCACTGRRRKLGHGLGVVSISRQSAASRLIHAVNRTRYAFAVDRASGVETHHSRAIWAAAPSNVREGGRPVDVKARTPTTIAARGSIFGGSDNESRLAVTLLESTNEWITKNIVVTRKT
jgi:hypothetical protein